MNERYTNERYKNCTMWFVIVSLEERLHNDLSFHGSFSHASWRSLKVSPPCSPSSEGLVWPGCVRFLAPQAIWLHHRLERHGGRAENIISRGETGGGQEPTGVMFIYLRTWTCAMSSALSLLLPILHLFLCCCSDGESLHCWAWPCPAWGRTLPVESRLRGVCVYMHTNMLVQIYKRVLSSVISLLFIAHNLLTNQFFILIYMCTVYFTTLFYIFSCTIEVFPLLWICFMPFESWIYPWGVYLRLHRMNKKWKHISAIQTSLFLLSLILNLISIFSVV